MISVCMATYNGERFLEEQMRSILDQLGSTDELIISDDGSTDNTVEIIKSFQDNRIRFFTGNYKNVIKNFENALSKARGDIIFLADQDDVWLEAKVNKVKSLLTAYDLVVTDSYIVDERLRIIHPSFFEHFNSKKGILKNVLKSTYFGSCMAFRASLLKFALPFPDTKEIGHDLWLGLVGEMTGKVIFVKDPMIQYRRHGETFTAAGTGKSGRSLITKMKGRMIMFSEIIQFYIKYRVCKRV